MPRERIDRGRAGLTGAPSVVPQSSTGRGRPDSSSRWSRHETLPMTAVPGAASPASGHGRAPPQRLPTPRPGTRDPGRFLRRTRTGSRVCRTRARFAPGVPVAKPHRIAIPQTRDPPPRRWAWLDSAADVPPRSRHRPRLRRAAARLRPVARRAPEPPGADRARPLRRPAELRPADHGPRVVGHDLVAEPGRARLLRLPQPQGPQL